MSDRAAIAKFLGEGAAEGGPMALLGLGPREITPARVEAALQHRLECVDEHAQAFTPEADEVRLALHTAAAQLLDPKVRGELLRQVYGEDARVEDAVPPPLPPSTDRVDLLAPLGREAASGVPVIESLVPPDGDRTQEVVAARTARYERERPRSDESDREGDSYAAFRGERVRRGVPGVVWVGGACVIGLVGGAIALVVLQSKSPSAGPAATSVAAQVQGATTPSDPAPQPVASASGGASGAPGTDSGEVPVARVGFVEPGVVIRELRRLAELAKQQPEEAARKAGAAIAPLADWWCQYDLAQRRAAVDAVVEVYFAIAPQSAPACRMSEMLRAWAGDAISAQAATAGTEPRRERAPYWRSAFALGVLTRLGGERDLPRSGAACVSEALNQLLGAGRSDATSTFEAGAIAAFRAIAPRLGEAGTESGVLTLAGARLRVGDFVSGVRAAAHDDPAMTERVLVDALERLVLDAPEADRDAGVHAVMGELVAAIKWRASGDGGSGRKRLLEWFRDQRVTISDLHVLTTALTARSSAEGVDQSMVLSIGGTPDDRVRVRSQIAKAWNMGDVETRVQAIAELASAASVLMQPLGGTGASADLETLATAARGERYCEAARLIWYGDAAAGLSYMRDTQGVIDTALVSASAAGGFTAPAGPAPVPGSGKLSTSGGAPAQGQPTITDGDGAWSERYLQAERNIPVRQEVLAQLGTMQRPIGITDASVLVEQAMFATPAQVRMRAQFWVKRFATDASIMQATLEQLPGAPRIPSVGDMIESVAGARLPKVSHPGWELAARRELVARLLASIAESSEEAGVDRLAAVIAGAVSSNTPGPQGDDMPKRAAAGARAMWDRWHAEALAVSGVPGLPAKLGDVERRRQSRLSVASGPVQVFVAEQLSIVELMGIVVTAERPASKVRIAEALGGLAADNRAARHVFAQLLACERAKVRLWLIRLGQEGGG